MHSRWQEWGWWWWWWWCYCVWHRKRCMCSDAQVDRTEASCYNLFCWFFLTQSGQSVPELDTGSHLAEIQLFLGDLNHFHIAELTMGWGKISPNAGDAKPFWNPEAATWLDVRLKTAPPDGFQFNIDRPRCLHLFLDNCRCIAFISSSAKKYGI